MRLTLQLNAAPRRRGVCDLQGGYELDLNSPKVWEFLAGTAAGANGTNAFGQQRGYTIAPTGTKPSSHLGTCCRTSRCQRCC